MPDELHDLIQRAYRRRRTRAKEIVADCLERLPEYRGIPESMVREIEASSEHHLAILYRITLDVGRSLKEEDLVYSRELARKRAAQGVPLGPFLTFFLLGLTRAWEHLVSISGDDPRLREQLFGRVTAVISNQTQLMTALTESYVEERERLSRFQEQDSDDFAQLLITGEGVGNVMEARAQALGISLDDLHHVAVVGPTDPRGSRGPGVGPEELRESLTALIPGTPVFVGRSREGFVALLPELPARGDLEDAVVGLLGDTARVGTGGPGHGIEGLRRSAREALRALHIGESLDRLPRVRSYDEVAVLDLVGIDSERAAEFARSVLGPLAEPGASPAPLETLRALAAHNYHLKSTAGALDVHPHTLTYRVKQLRRRHGIDLDDPELRLRMQLALRILDARRSD